MPFNKKVQKTNKEVDPDFINFATHFNKNTLLTKNGELVQIIRITGLAKYGDESSQITLRDIIRDSIYDNLDRNNKFAFWFHTVRRKKDLTLRLAENHQDNELTKMVNDLWHEKNEWHSQYTNELYISIVSQSSTYWKNSNSQNSFASIFSQGSMARDEARALKNLSKEISIFTNKLLLDLSEHGAKLLGVREWEGVYYSEPMRFLGKIINLEERRYPVNFNDISHELSHSQIVFGNRDVQVLSNKKSNFCSILSLKEYVEVPLQLMDKILSLNFEFIITQSFDLFYNSDEIKSYGENLKILKISDDLALEEVSGLGNYENYENQSQKEFGSLQTTITIITDEYEKIESEISSALEEFGALGLIMVREDIFLEHCFWSRLPGNFPFLKRQKAIKTLQVPGFSAINSIPSGSFDGNIWGPAITTLKTILGTPYFFNFHNNRNKPSTLIQGPEATNKNTFANFLALQSLKANTEIFFIDSVTKTDILTKCLNGKTFNFTNGNDTDKLNPLSLTPDDENINATLELLNAMTKFIKGGVGQEEILQCKEIIAETLRDPSSNFLIAFDKLRGQATENVYQKLKTWVKGSVAKYFSADKDIEFASRCNNFNFSQIINAKPLAIAIFVYITNKIFDYSRNNDKKSILVIEEPMLFLNNPYFADKIEDFISRAESSGVVLILKHSNHLSLKNIELYKKICDSCATQIFYPNNDEEEYTEGQINLDESEIDALKYMTIHSQKNLILKKDDVPIILQNNLSSIDELSPIISNDNISNIVAQEIHSEDPEISNSDLINQVIEVFKEYQESEKKLALQAIAKAQIGSQDGDI